MGFVKPLPYREHNIQVSTSPCILHTSQRYSTRWFSVNVWNMQAIHISSKLHFFELEHKLIIFGGCQFVYCEYDRVQFINDGVLNPSW